MTDFYYKIGDLDDRVTNLEGQVLDLSSLTDGDFLQYDSSESALVPKSISEMKTLLGLPQSIYVGRFTQASTAQPYVYTPIKNNFETNIFTLTEVVPDTIYYADEFIRQAQGTYYLNIGEKGGLPSGSSIDIILSYKDGVSGKYMGIDVSGANLILYNYDVDGNLVDGFDIILTIKKWI